MTIIIGNAIALVASIIMVYSGYLKQKKQILYAQTIQMGLSVVSNFILGGITGALINVLGCIRNILCYKEKLNNIAKSIIIVLATVLTLFFNNLGFIGWFPLIYMITYILFMNTKDVIRFKYLIIFTVLLWFCYDLYVKSYTAAGFDFFSMLTNFVSIIQIKKNKTYKKEIKK